MLKLIVGTKRYSSWSLRAWLALKLTGAAFEEVLVPLRRPDTRARILPHSPSGKVPALHDGDIVVWESLAICEYLAERFPAAGLWPEDFAARALARSVSAEMHAGFAALRRELPMDCPARLAVEPGPEAAEDIRRIGAIWTGCRARYGRGGRFLFGPPGAADAMFAPVASRFRTYGISLGPVADGYRDAVLDMPEIAGWLAAAGTER